jgi:hypothetical protein
MSKTVLKLCFISCALLLVSCAAPRIELPDYEGADVRDVLREREQVENIESIFSIVFEREDSEIKGSGALNLSRSGDMTLRVYSFGFLAFELTSDNGIIKSSDPAIDRNKGILLTYGLRDCLFWWDMDNKQITEDDNGYLLYNHQRKVWLDRKTMLPTRQIIGLEDGRELDISYEVPQKFDKFWFPSKIRIELSKYAVVLNIKEMLFVPHS